jgi:nicotinamidase-related amidase
VLCAGGGRDVERHATQLLTRAPCNSKDNSEASGWHLHSFVTGQNTELPPKSSRDLHGNAPDRSAAALVLIDVINDLNFPGNEHLVGRSRDLAEAIGKLKERCTRAGIPSIYVNDNRGKWRSDFRTVLEHCLCRGTPGAPMVRKLQPTDDDYIVLKPKHSALYATPLETLLEYIGARSIIVTGVTTNACVMVTVSELYVRDFRLFVPSDCVAALSEEEQRRSLELMKNNFGAEIMLFPL